MTNSELFVLMASGMAHISGGMMVVYISYGADCRMQFIITADGRKAPADLVPTDAERIEPTGDEPVGGKDDEEEEQERLGVE
jgi:nucleoside permease NupC